MDLAAELTNRGRHPDYWALVDAVSANLPDDVLDAMAEYALANEHPIVVEGIGVRIEGGELQLPRAVVEFYLRVAHGYRVDPTLLRSIRVNLDARPSG